MMKNTYYKTNKAIKNYFEELLVQNQPDILILIGSNSYCNYKISYNKPSNFLVITDQYIENSTESVLKQILNNKKVLIYEDTITRPDNEKKLLYYKKICEKYQASSIILSTYAIEGSIQDKLTNDINFKILLNGSDMEQFLLWQTTNYQYDINSPEKEIISYKATIPISSFYDLINKHTFIKDDINKAPLKKSHLEFSIELPILTKYISAIKCKYQINDENKTVDIVFTPITILTSTYADEIINDFNILCQNNFYKLEILESYKNFPIWADNSLNLTKIMAKDIKTLINLYTGITFKQYLKENFKLDINCDFGFVSENFNNDFTTYLKQISTSNHLLPQIEISQKSDLEYEENYTDHKDNATQLRINIDLIREIMKSKKYSLENWERHINEKFRFNGNNRQQMQLTAIIRYTDINMIESDIYIDNGAVKQGLIEEKNCKVMLFRE